MKSYLTNKYYIIFGILFCINAVSAIAQQKIAPNIYLFRLVDKNNTKYSISKPEDFLSQRALSRRARQKISVHENDLPISNIYIDSLTHSGYTIIKTSKWLNAVAIQITSDTMFTALAKMSFIVPFYPLQKCKSQQSKTEEKKFREFTYDTLLTKESYGSSYAQIAMHNGEYLHNLRYRGDSMLIAILDGGFAGAPGFSSLQTAWNENRVILQRDIVDKTGATFYNLSHGTNVFSIIGSYQKNAFIGTAPNANFALIRTEDAQSEYPIEELNWVIGAELADSIGADIIHSSLGYNTFNDASLNYTYQQMDGKTALSTQGAKIAASKGIIAVISAGNEGANSWKYITAPSDADSILTVGAISATKQIASFSSRGPTADGRIKPDVVAVGQGTATQSGIYGNGTSYSAPVITGLTACLWQACPNKTNFQIMEAIKKSATQYQTPDTIIGYGIPDFKKALQILRNELSVIVKQSEPDQLLVSPNPFESAFILQFGPTPTASSQMYITDIQGRTIYNKAILTNTYIQNSTECTMLANKANGLYFIHIISGNKHLKAKVVKR
jgi:hypothetical protein